MDDSLNCQWRIARRPSGNVTIDDFEYREEAIPEPGDGQILLKTYYVNVAPVMRMYMSGESFAGETPLAIGEILHGRAVAEVVESNHPDYEVGEFVHGQVGWQTYAVSNADAKKKFRKIPDRGICYSSALGILGMSGYSAYFGFVDCGKPREGDIAVISAAGGGVGSQVVQIAKIFGCRVVGIAGGPEKCDFVRSLGCDAVIDYQDGNMVEQLATACPDGIDIYFDNVGGDTLSAALEHLRMHARVVLCGSISEYLRDEPYGLKNYTRLRRTNSTMQGFFVYNHAGEFDRAEQDMFEWLQAGKN